MKFFGFYPETVAVRVRSAAVPPRVPTLGQSLGVGAAGFALVAVAVFAAIYLTAEWVKKTAGDVGSFAIWALLFVLPASGLFSRLVIRPAPLFRFYLLFAGAFVIYSAAWTAGYLPLQDKRGEWLGSLLGTSALGLTLATAFDAPRQALKVIAVLFVARSSGYFSGEFLHHAIAGLAGWVLWGAAYGLGLGAGLGYALYACQEPARARLKAIQPPATTSAMTG